MGKEESTQADGKNATTHGAVIGVTGLAGSGKDAVADVLVRDFGFARVAFADPMKRFCLEMFGWSAATLWGPSEARNKEDVRYVYMRRGALGSMCVEWTEDGHRIDEPNPSKDLYLTPRYALQKLGDWGRECYPDIWVDRCLKTCYEVLYRQKGVVIPDVRFNNEAAAIRKVGGKIWSIRRPSADRLSGDAGAHVSERGIDSDLIDVHITNDGTLEQLRGRVHALMKEET